MITLDELLQMYSIANDVSYPSALAAWSADKIDHWDLMDAYLYCEGFMGCGPRQYEVYRLLDALL